MKHTAGPWYRVIPERLDGVEEVQSVEPGEHIAFCVGRANARLIAAAPEMADYIEAKAAEGDEQAQAIMDKING